MEMRMSKDWIEEFVGRNVYSVLPSEQNASRCIDGRYEGRVPPLAKSGADAGDLMISCAAFSKLGIDPASKWYEILQAVLDTVGGVKKFRFHTDEHAEGEGAGCGHLKKALEDPDPYKLSRESMELIFEELKNLKQQGAREDVLQGPHREKAVLLITSRTHSVSPRIDEGGTSNEVFVLHATLLKTRMDLLAEHLLPIVRQSRQEMGKQKLQSALLEAANLQANVTVGKLAPHLPVFSVTIRHDGSFSIHEELPR